MVSLNLLFSQNGLEHGTWSLEVTNLKASDQLFSPSVPRPSSSGKTSPQLPDSGGAVNPGRSATHQPTPVEPINLDMKQMSGFNPGRLQERFSAS